MPSGFASCKSGLACACVALLMLVGAAYDGRAIVAAGATPSLSGVSTGRLKGAVTWEGRDLPGAVVYLYRDATLQDLQGTYPLLSPTGEFDLRIEPGSYYVVGVLDRNRNGTFDAGDLLGVHGIRQWSDMGQRKLVVTVTAGQTVTDVDVPISALRRHHEAGGGIEGLAGPDSVEGAAGSATGEATASIAGLVRLSAGGRMPTDAPVYVLAYVHLAWHRWLGQARVEPDGTFKLSLPPGSYFVAAMADQNRSNVFDAGDLIGFQGVSGATSDQLASAPSIVTLAESDARTELDIPIVARLTSAGRLVALDTPPEDDGADTGTVELAGEVRWGTAGLPATVVELYADAGLAHRVARAAASPSGRFRFSVAPGHYFIVANVDVDGDGRVSPGDGVGGSGTADVSALPPQPYRAAADASPAIVEVSATYGTAAELIPLQRPAGQSEGASAVVTTSGISGRVLWDGRSPHGAWLLVSKSEGFPDPQTQWVSLDQSGSYALRLDPGTYYVMAVVDASANGEMGEGDGIAVYGTSNPLAGAPTPVRVWQARTTPFIDVSVGALTTDGSGGHAALNDGNRSVIRRTYGEPNDRYRRRDNGRLLEEWCYWKQGLSFTFAADGPGWNLEDTYRFTPNLQALEEMRPSDLSMAPRLAGHYGVDAIVYYSGDGVIWALHPDGSQQPIANGTQPLPTARGVLYVDEDHDLVMVDSATGEGVVAVPRQVGFEHAAVSSGGRTLALIQAGGLRILPLGEQRELAVPLGLATVTSVSWHRSRDLLLLSGIKRSDAPTDGDLFVYDPAANRLEPVLADVGDDTEVACSPTDSRHVAFTRRDDSGSQVWLLELADTGRNGARQLTEFGGSQPAWLPDGTGLVYVVNGQLWTIDVEVGADSARPLIVNGEVVLGDAPATQALEP